MTSVPSRRMTALPSGIRKSGSSGTSPLTAYSVSASMKMTGLSSRMADFSSPLASAGVEGRTTLSPGTW